MDKTNRRGIVRTHRTKLIAFIRLFDIAIIGITLNCLLIFYKIEFVSYPVWVLLIAIMSFEFFAEFNQLYNAPRGVKLLTETKMTFGSWAGVVLVFFLIIQAQPALIKGYEEVFLVWVVLVPIELTTWHVLLRLVINYCRSLGRNTRQVAIIGATEIGAELKIVIEKESWLGFSFVGCFDDRVIKEKGRHPLKIRETER